MKRFLTAVLVLSLALACLAPSNALALTESQIKKSPYSAIACIKTVFKCGCTRWGSGFMVAPNGLITAATQLVCIKHSKAAKTMEYYFGMEDLSNYRYHYSGSATTYYYTTFPKGYDDENDIGYVVFPRDIGKETGWFATSFRDSTSDFKGGESSKIFGYDLNWKMDYDYVTLYPNGSTKRVRYNKYYKEYTAGSPIGVYRNGESDPTIRAIHVSHNSDYYFARSLTYDMYKEMIKNGVRFSH